MPEVSRGWPQLAPAPTATKRKREDNPEVKSPNSLRKLLSSATSDASAEVALLSISWRSMVI